MELSDLCAVQCQPHSELAAARESRLYSFGGIRLRSGLRKHRLLLWWVMMIGALSVGCSAKQKGTVTRDDPFLSMTDPTEAVNRLTVRTKAEPENASVWHELGRAYVNLGRFDAAIEPLQKAAQKAPERGDSWALLGLALKRVDRLEDAALSYGKALSCVPGSAEYLANYRELMEGLGLYDELVSKLTTLLRGRPEGVTVLNTLARDYLRAGQGSFAEDAALASLSFDNTQAEMHLVLARSLDQQERFDAAAMAYRQYLTHIDPTQQDKVTTGEAGLGRALLEQGDLDAAAALLDKVLAREPDRVDALYSRIRVALKKEELTLAGALLRDALTAAPDSVLIQVAQAELYLKQGHATQALSVLTMARPHAEHDRHLNELMARAYLAADQPERTLEIVERLKEQDPESQMLVRLRCAALSKAEQRTLYATECKDVALTDEFAGIRDATDAENAAQKSRVKSLQKASQKGSTR